MPVLLGAGQPQFGALPHHIKLGLVDVGRGSGVTHLHYRVQK